MREVGPCLGWAGVREQLQGARVAPARGRVDRRWSCSPSTPDWAATPPRRLRASATPRRARAPSHPPRAWPPTARLRDRRDLAWAPRGGPGICAGGIPWNQANHPAFVSPQRESAATRRSAPSRAPAVYTRDRRRSPRLELDAAPGDQQLVLGELSGTTRLMKTVRHGTSVGEFVDALPDDVRLREHRHVVPARLRRAGVRRRRRPGPRRRRWRRRWTGGRARPGPTIWVTETGAGGADPRESATGRLDAAR